jgi:hypothetical protein
MHAIFVIFSTVLFQAVLLSFFTLLFTTYGLIINGVEVELLGNNTLDIGYVG